MLLFMTFLWSILIGLALGFISGFFTHRRDPGSFVVRMLIGVICAILLLLLIPPSVNNSMLFNALGVIILLFIYSLFFGKRKKI